MELETPQLLWLVGMSVLGGLLGWVHRRLGKPKSFDYAVNAVFTALFISFIGCEIARHFTGNVRLAIMIGGGMAYYSDHVLEIGKKILDRRGEKL